ncbi:MAG: hypothetical protein M5U28_11785 [Sandaracinaceae bacterium]|nr:hypothetical protein [Sandaracinaceae bacterium]
MQQGAARQRGDQRRRPGAAPGLEAMRGGALFVVVLDEAQHAVLVVEIGGQVGQDGRTGCFFSRS